MTYKILLIGEGGRPLGAVRGSENQSAALFVKRDGKVVICFSLFSACKAQKIYPTERN